QTELRFRTWGGKRAGAGRKPNGRRAGIAHTPRPAIDDRRPVHVTLKVRGMPNLRSDRMMAVMRESLRHAKERFGMRVVHFSVQRDHVHAIVEAMCQPALARAVQGLAIRLSRRW